LFKGGQANLYVYVRNDPVNRRDPSGLADIFVGIEGDLVGITGFEGGFGLVIDTDSLEKSGLFIQGGPGSGANVGVAVCGGFTTRDIEGWGTDVDVNAGKFSPVILMDDKGLSGFAVGLGPGIGLSYSATYTSTLTVSQIWDWAKELFK